MLAAVLSSLLIIASFQSSSSSIIATDPLFTETLDMIGCGADGYRAFIDGLRNKLGDPRHFSHNRPVLPPVEAPDTPGPMFHVELTTPIGGRLTLAIRADILSLEGFQSHDGTWWELALGAIPNATYVGFGHTYGDLLGGEDRLLDVSLGTLQMAVAAHILGACTRADLTNDMAQEQAKHALATLRLMVNEATRLTTVSDLVADGLMHRPNLLAVKSNTITPEMKAQVNGWDNLSAALLKADVRPGEPFTPFKDMGVWTVEQAAKTVGILLFVKV
ncbi:hypothetical protein ACP4OV_022102 [Aristida adscensionis]